MKRYAVHIPLILAVVWCYAADLTRLIGRWWSDPDYVYGFLVIPFSVYLLRRRWDLLGESDAQKPAGSWWGIVLVGLSILVRCASAYMSDPIFGPLSLIPCLAGIVLLVGGWKALHWSWPALAFLVFMIPLPSFVATFGNLVLQRIATVLSTFVLQTVGIAAVAYGNVIQMADGQLSVAEACSGLRSTMLFFAVSVGAAFLVSGLPEKLVVLLSAIPATIAANVFRIASTGVLHELVGAEWADAVFHDLFGFIMLPVAALIVWAEIWIVRKLLVHEAETGPLPLGQQFVGTTR